MAAGITRILEATDDAALVRIACTLGDMLEGGGIVLRCVNRVSKLRLWDEQGIAISCLLTQSQGTGGKTCSLVMVECKIS